MPHEYDDPFNKEAVDAAVAMALALCASKPGRPLAEHVEAAVHRHICACAIDIEDHIEQGHSQLHTAVSDHITSLVEAHLAARSGGN
ncbi:hypothetical protein ACIPPQ_00470 [Sphingopyxis sp. LARHCG72]